MDVDEQEMPEHNAHCWVGLFAQQIEERRLASLTASWFGGTCMDFRI